MGTKKISGPGRLGSAEAVKKSLKSGGSGNPNIRTVPGEGSLTVRILEEPEDFVGFYEHWMGDAPIPCVEGECDGCDSDDPDEQRKMFRYLMNAYVVDDQKVRVLKLPKSLVEQLFNYYQKYGTLLDRDYDLSKTGSGKYDTKYMAAPDSKNKMKLERFKKSMFDTEKMLADMANGTSSDDDIPPKKSKKEKQPWDDEDDEPPFKKKSKGVKKKKSGASKSASVKKPVKKTASSKKSIKRTVKK